MFDVTGYLPPSLGGNPDNDVPLYSTCKVYSDIWGFRHPLDEAPAFWPKAYDPQPGLPTVCFRDHYWVYGTDDRASCILGKAVTSLGPWGPDIYPEVGLTRDITTMRPIVAQNYGKGGRM